MNSYQRKATTETILEQNFTASVKRRRVNKQEGKEMN